jgi:hypothetical protein
VKVKWLVRISHERARCLLPEPLLQLGDRVEPPPAAADAADLVAQMLLEEVRRSY